MIKQYRKKPVVIEAVQWNGGNLGEIIRFTGGKNNIDMTGGELKIDTLEGRMTAQEEDYIIKGIRGEFYPCKPDIFKATYEEVE